MIIKKIIKTLNNIFTFTVLFLFYFSIMGLAHLIQRIYHFTQKKPQEKSYWMEANLINSKKDYSSAY